MQSDARCVFTPSALLSRFVNVIIVIGMAPFSTHILLYICVLQASVGERTVKMAIAESFRMMVEGDFGFVALVS